MSDNCFTDADGPLVMSPLQPLQLSQQRPREFGDVNIGELGGSSGSQIRKRVRSVAVKETPVPTVLYDMDAPPYVDDPAEEGMR